MTYTGDTADIDESFDPTDTRVSHAHEVHYMREAQEAEAVAWMYETASTVWHNIRLAGQYLASLERATTAGERGAWLHDVRRALTAASTHHTYLTTPPAEVDLKCWAVRHVLRDTDEARLVRENTGKAMQHAAAIETRGADLTRAAQEGRP